MHSASDSGVGVPWISYMPEFLLSASHVYRGVLSGTPPADAGDCHQTDLLTWYTPVAEDPAPGTAFSYLVTAETAAGGEGPLGTSSSGAPRTAGTTCP